AAHFTESDETVVRFHLDDGADEAPPMTPIRVAKGRFDGDTHRGGPDVDDLHAAAGEWGGTLSRPEGSAKDQLTLSLLCWPQSVGSVNHSSRVASTASRNRPVEAGVAARASRSAASIWAAVKRR